MKKEIIYKEIEDIELNVNSKDSIKPLITWLSKMVEKGATTISFSGSADDCTVEEITCTAYSSEEETDAQFDLRVKKNEDILKFNENIKEELERATYEILKAKFEIYQ